VVVQSLIDAQFDLEARLLIVMKPGFSFIRLPGHGVDAIMTTCLFSPDTSHPIMTNYLDLIDTHTRGPRCAVMRDE
jgi:hypothetical protein